MVAEHYGSRRSASSRHSRSHDYGNKRSAGARQQLHKYKLPALFFNVNGYSNYHLWRSSSTILHRDQQEDPCLRHQACSLQAMQLQDHDAVKHPRLSASRPLDRGYGLDFNPRHCTITHGQQQAHFLRLCGLGWHSHHPVSSAFTKNSSGVLGLCEIENLDVCSHWVDVVSCRCVDLFCS